MIETYADGRGYLSVIENCPFPIERVFWIYSVPEGKSRAGHKHETCEQILICVQGMVFVDLDGEKSILTTNDHVIARAGTMIELKRFTTGSILLVLASEKYNADSISKS